MQQFSSAYRNLSLGVWNECVFSGDRCNKTQDESEKNPINKGNRFFKKVLQSYYFLVCILSLYLLILG